MAWVESHTVLGRHRKVVLLADFLKVEIPSMVGHLHLLWHAVLEQQEDGDLSQWSDSVIAHAAMWKGDAPTFVTALRQYGWIDGSLIHDWLDYVGEYLTRKYHSSDPQKLSTIWKAHGYKYGKGKGKYGKIQGSKKEVKSQQEVRLPNPSFPNPSEPDLTKPNLTVVVSARERKLGELEALSLSEELQSWASAEFSVRIPEDVLTEFKAYWREQTKLRTDWMATFKSRIRQLVARGILKPKKRDVFEEFLEQQGAAL
jgi:hypothetical protein